MFRFTKRLTKERPAVTNFHVMYIDEEGNCISNLCVKADFLSKNANIMTSRLFFIPNIGETVLDKDANIEYEVKDVLRTIGGNEYGVQVRLRKREKNKYEIKLKEES